MADRFALPKARSFKTAPRSEAAKKHRARALKLMTEFKVGNRKRGEANRAERHALKLRTYKYASEYHKEREDLIKMKREARARGGFYRLPEPKVIFCVRLKGINKLAPKPKMILRLFRLRQLHNGVFIRLNKATIEMLKAVQPFVTYGTPSLATIRNLIYKRGYARVGARGCQQRIRIQDNSDISKQLGRYGIHGIEDLVHEIYTCGPAFKQCNQFLWSFKLSSPVKGFVAKRHGFTEMRGGDWGNRECLMDELLSRMI